MSRREGSNNDETLLFDEADLSELCCGIIADIDTNDDDYYPDVKHLLSYPNNPMTKKKYVNIENSFKAFCNKQ
eukprot:100213-Ditylum_brightwellii.AAC.1